MSEPTLQTKIAVTSGNTSEQRMTFVWGQQVSPISVGARGEWAVSAPGVLDVHLFVSFDGRQVHVMPATPAGQVTVRGQVLGEGWQPVPVPSEIGFGGARLSVVCEERASTRPPPTAGLFERTWGVEEGVAVPPDALRRLEAASAAQAANPSGKSPDLFTKGGTSSIAAVQRQKPAAPNAPGGTVGLAVAPTVPIQAVPTAAIRSVAPGPGGTVRPASPPNPAQPQASHGAAVPKGTGGHPVPPAGVAGQPQHSSPPVYPGVAPHPAGGAAPPGANPSAPMVGAQEPNPPGRPPSVVPPTPHVVPPTPRAAPPVPHVSPPHGMPQAQRIAPVPEARGADPRAGDAAAPAQESTDDLPVSTVADGGRLKAHAERLNVSLESGEYPEVPPRPAGAPPVQAEPYRTVPSPVHPGRSVPGGHAASPPEAAGAAASPPAAAKKESAFARAWKETSLSKKLILVLLPLASAALLLEPSGEEPPAGPSPTPQSSAVAAASGTAASAPSASAVAEEVAPEPEAAASANTAEEAEAAPSAAPAPSASGVIAGSAEPRAALDAVFAGDHARAADIYRGLAKDFPEQAAYPLAEKLAREGAVREP